tara:strand:- start:185 stop:949 length:765 start_codon:yes stop_codon:yes gene_type:complete
VFKKKHFKFKFGDPTLIFFHGLCGNKSHFDKSFSYLKKFGILTFDLIGFGMNQKKIIIKNSIINQQAEYVKNIILNLNSNELVLIFHSLSTVLIPFILKNNKISKKISKLILIEGDIVKEQLNWANLLSSMEKKKFNIYIKNFKRNSKMVMLSQLIAQKNYKPSHSYSFKNFNSILLKKFSKECVKIIRKNKVYLNIKNSKAKKLLIVSKKNKNLYNRKTQNLFNQIEFIKNSGHYPMIDNPLQTYKKIKKFII